MSLIHTHRPAQQIETDMSAPYPVADLRARRCRLEGQFTLFFYITSNLKGLWYESPATDAWNGASVDVLCSRLLSSD